MEKQVANLEGVTMRVGGAVLFTLSALAVSLTMLPVIFITWLFCLSRWAVAATVR